MIKIDIRKSLDGAIDGMELEIEKKIKDGEFLAITGASGSGKTTLLRVLSGLENATGSIIVDGKIWLDSAKSLPVQKRNIGFVFQNYALFENMSVEQNLLFVSKDKVLSNKLLEMTDMIGLKDRLPSKLSGGQKQRVALCRAIMRRPRLLLMDEPLSALDLDMRVKLQEEILKIHKEFGITTIMTSHDPSEIYRLSDRVWKLENAKVIADGRPKDILLRAHGSQKFSFTGELLDIVQEDAIYIAIISIGQQIVEIVLSPNERIGLNLGDKVSIGVKAFEPTLESVKQIQIQ